ncbi:hypothetical protein M885DRAFT_530552 [Pelagophyceae sp. CCMP2097]|nr:hypothetical protein M885DRAFT_530552 [Pelagophyceae sp. CCMP2097]|mmetsp:Transcript_9718/g.32020  ORF Transcript_9718/g.32020 Transcript_9718/m.32020 type:complete len:170 (+) Transcript_9718:69-578(+)|eukprot:CAMPEP_0184094982 /NCGR_PEP_ID=MMETSP0974-20121125/9535_1 /TAXON_ID=483370 /ORGANISM="non described non described, Strain CCMP2097" /LENGTH=169 /DNA_ID=CAMNT_0026397771 /DNA_START=69 /DNA_END=578 /DNA_ORIENTATION=-
MCSLAPPSLRRSVAVLDAGAAPAPAAKALQLRATILKAYDAIPLKPQSVVVGGVVLVADIWRCALEDALEASLHSVAEIEAFNLETFLEQKVADCGDAALQAQFRDLQRMLDESEAPAECYNSGLPLDMFEFAQSPLQEVEVYRSLDDLSLDDLPAEDDEADYDEYRWD